MNKEGERIIDFAVANKMAILNTYFSKSNARKCTYTSGGKNTQVDYILCRRETLKEVKDCKVIPGESVAKQHKLLISQTKIGVYRRREEKRVKKTRWWKLEDPEFREKYVQKVRQALEEKCKEGWKEVSRSVRNSAKAVLGETSGKSMQKMATWWWSEEVQKMVLVKKDMKKLRDSNRTQENIERYKRANKVAKRVASQAKAAAYKDLYKSLDEKEGLKKALRIAKQKHKNSMDVYQAKTIKDEGGRTLSGDNEIKEIWRSYFCHLMNVENERVDRDVELREESEEENDIVTRDEVEAALRRMKKGKAVGPDDIPAEACKCLGEIGVKFLTNLMNTILETERMPEDWRESALVPIYKGKGDIQDCGNYRGIKLMSHTMKTWERIMEVRLRRTVEISEEQFGFMPGRSTMDAIFALKQLLERYHEGQKMLHCAFIDLEKAYDRVPRKRCGTA